MKKILSLILAVSLCLALTSGCGKSVEEEGYLVNKDTLTVKLMANPTTGFTWAADIADDSVIAFVSDHYEVSKASSKAAVAGAGGFNTLTFKAVGEGTTTIKLTYAQQWEGGEEGRVETMQVTVDGDKKIQDIVASPIENE